MTCDLLIIFVNQCAFSSLIYVLYTKSSSVTKTESIYNKGPHGITVDFLGI